MYCHIASLELEAQHSWATTCPSAKRHLSGISLVGPMVVRFYILALGHLFVYSMYALGHLFVYRISSCHLFVYNICFSSFVCL